MSLYHVIVLSRFYQMKKQNLKLSQLNPIDSNIPHPTKIKEPKFENEDEWDIGGIPEILTELDADIEKALINIRTSKFDHTKSTNKNRTKIFNEIQQKHCEKYLSPYKIVLPLKSSKNKGTLKKHTEASTFAGFSKDGHLISNSAALYISQQLKLPKNLRQNCSVSMSSQSGSNGNSGSNISGTVTNISCSQNVSGSTNSNKTNNKMSIDHQATLDKGLKMKIKRTKPGTKSSEAKHEIVKATEQQQNGLLGSGNSICTSGQEGMSSLMSHQSSSTNSQSSNVGLGILNCQSSSNLSGNKKNLATGNNQNNISSTGGSVSLNSANSANNNVSQTLSQGTKRGSSGHRRDKTKEKSIRTGIEKNGNEKDSIEKTACYCNTADGNVSTCSCIRKTENSTLTQRLPAKNTSGNISAIPPGVFTPSADIASSAAVSNILPVTSTISSTVCTQTIASGTNANTPGPPSKEISATNSGNVKISSHIAAQLAAAAASNSTNSSCCTTSALSNVEVKTSSSSIPPQILKQLSPNSIPAGGNQTLSAPISNQKIPCVTGTEKPAVIPVLKRENLESPPAKRIKHTDNNAISSAVNKVDICIGTSIGTITEPDCLGPCEPGTSVTLEGIVWHETEGGVLVVNVTWRGKTYVGTLLDCTRHDWAPPRFCDSPTEDLDARAPKGRGKRGRATVTPDLSNFTETRSSIYFSHSHVHSKLRNGSTKGGRGSSRITNIPHTDKANCNSSLCPGNSSSTPSTSPTAFLPPRTEKRKSKDDSPPPVCADNECLSNNTFNSSGISLSSTAINVLANQPQSLISPVTGLNVQISTKKCKTSSPCAISPTLLECPENDCSKKYKHVNGLRYHQSHAHGSASLIDEDSLADTEEHLTPQPSPSSSTPPPLLTINPSDLIPNNQMAVTPELTTTIEESNTTKIDQEIICQQLGNSEKDSPSVATLPLSCDDVLTSTQSSNTTVTVAYSSESSNASTKDREQQKKLLDLMDNNKIQSLESNMQVTGKSGVVCYGQEEPKNNISSCILPTTTPKEIMFPDLHEADLTKTIIPGHQESNINDTFCEVSLENNSLQHKNEHNIAASKAPPSSLVVAKVKKERKSPSINDYEGIKVNSCNISSREDVQSPAYSDISDDSTPVNDSNQMEKADTSKNADVNKKSQEMNLSASVTGSSNQTSMSSTLGNYGMYQFYQQQQFIVPPGAEQQSAKTAINANMGSSIAQHQNISDFNSKKDLSLDVISKTSSNQSHSNQHIQELSKDPTRGICVSGNQGNSDLSNVPSIGSSALNSTAPSKAVSHFYAFNYMPSNYSFNVDHNFASAGSIASSEDNAKCNRLPGIPSPSESPQQLQTPVLYKDDRSKEEMCSTDAIKSGNIQIPLKQMLKSDSAPKPECIKQEGCSQVSQVPQHMQLSSKDHQGMGVYTNIYQRHPLALSSQHLSREEELRRYYIFSDQQRRHSNSSHNSINQQIQNSISSSGNQQCKDEITTQHAGHNQQLIKVKGNTQVNPSKTANSSNTSKESPKHKQEDELKVIKQEGQKPTMETQGPPPPPTSQYFLHPSYITSSPFGFDPSHPMYRNVLMPATPPYNTPSYHLPMPRYHAPEDLSRNTGTKALDALHHAASQYYTTHKIHELSERALKSPNNSNSNNVSATIKISGSSPNVGTNQHSNLNPNIIGHHAVQSQPAGVTQLPHNLSSQNIGITNKQDIANQKPHGIVPNIAITTHNETQKPQASINSLAATSCSSGNGNSNITNNVNSGSTSDSRSPPPQRHVHTHHHTHVGLGYPMYPAPYGAAVLASQQAAAVAVINPFPSGPNK